jgi:two-component system sensor histidine kinase EvgS
MFNSISRYLNGLPIRHKLLLLTGVVTVLALCLAVIAISRANWDLYRSLLLKNALAQAELLAASSIAPLTFDFPEEAQKNLEPLKNIPSIAAVWVFDTDKQLYARYYRNDSFIEVPFLTDGETFRYQGNQLIIQKMLETEDTPTLGKLVLVNDLQPFYKSLESVWFFTALAALLGMIGGYLLFHWGQRLITEPVITLTNVMNRVRSNHDYTLRILPKSRDELGELAHGFNDMLTQIQKRDQRLEQYNRDLAQAVDERTHELALTMQGLREARDRAEQANQAKSRFLTNVSHELRTPLNAILGFAEILKQQTRQSLENKYLEIIGNSGKTLLNLINEILDLARIESGKIQLDYHSVNLQRVVQNVSSFFTPKAEEKKLQLNIELAEDLPQAIVTDENRLQQILVNLLGNAIKFTIEGHVTLRLEVEWHSAHKLDLRISITDTGIGIAEGEQERIFHAFEQQSQQSQNEFGGTGLGLTITKNLVDLMNGDIQVFSKANLGSCFSVTLYDLEVLDHNEANKQTEEFLTEDSVLFAPARILIVDDLALNREIFKAYLGNYPFGVIEADNIEQFTEILSKHKPDLVFIDLKITDFNDEMLLRNLEAVKQLKRVPVVGVIAQSIQQDTENLCCCCDSYIAKPITRNALLRCLADFLPHQIIQIKNDDGLYAHVQHEAQTISVELQQALRRYYPIWQNLNELSAINSVEEFASEVLQLAQAHDCAALEDWALRLQEQASSFDIVNIPDTLREFEQFLELERI